MAQQRRVERPEPGGVEGPQIGAARAAVSDQLRQGLPGRWRVEDASDAVSGCHVSAIHLRDLADQRQAVLREGTEAGLPNDDLLGTQCR